MFTGKTLQYVEQTIAHWVMSTDALALMMPSPDGCARSAATSRWTDYAQWLDGLVLHGGADVSPRSYGETAAAARVERRPRSATTTRSTLVARVRSGTASRCSASAAACS